MIRRFLSSSLLVLVALAGCHSSQNVSTQESADQNLKVYHLRGKVISTDPAHGLVVLDHEAIPGFMDAMTMPYQLKDPSIVSDLHPGDVITADVLVSKNSEETVQLDHIVVVAKASPTTSPQLCTMCRRREMWCRTLHFATRMVTRFICAVSRQGTADYFIYTRCPLPNFCPLVTHNFAVIEKQLAASPALYGKTHLLCVSFDPEHDTPERLKAYGTEYIGSDSKSAFAHWDFAVPQKTVLAEMAKYFDVGITWNR